MNKKRLFAITGLSVVVIAIVVIGAVKLGGRSSSVDPRRVPAALVQVEQPRRETVQYQLKFTGDVTPISSRMPPTVPPISPHSNGNGTARRFSKLNGEAGRRGPIIANPTTSIASSRSSRRS